MKIISTLAGVLLLGSSLAACGGDGSDGGDGGDRTGGSYCQDIAAAKPVFEDLSQGNLAQLEKGFATFHELADKAPADLKDAWKILDDAATSVEEAIQGAGLTFSDLAGIQDGQVPAGLDVTKLTGLAADLQDLNSSEFSDARAKIADQAKDACDVELGAS